MLSRRQFLHSLPLTAGFLTACEEKAPPARYTLPEKPLQIITTTIHAADLIRIIGGEAVNVRSLIAPEINPHLWQPSATDLGIIQIADAFFLSGLRLESRFTADLNVLRNRGLQVGVLANGLHDDDILTRPDGKPDPHFWMNPRLWAKAATEAAAVLADTAPALAPFFQDRAHEYLIELADLHRSVLDATKDLPERSRFFLTTHDSMAYFADAYSLEFRSLANAAGEMPLTLPAELTSWIRDHSLHHVFREQFTDIQMIKKVTTPLFLSIGDQILSLSLAKPGTSLPGLTSELAVDSYLPAQRYTSNAITAHLKLL
jgi:manganese/zinc/iron transport system substrate-binding protein